MEGKSVEQRVYDIKKRSYLYALGIVRFLQTMPNDYITQTIAKQLLRSATSVGANIIEAQAASSRKDFTNFYSHALKSANESKFWLNLLQDSGNVSPERIESLRKETNELSNILASSILTAKGKKKF